MHSLGTTLLLFILHKSVGRSRVGTGCGYWMQLTEPIGSGRFYIFIKTLYIHLGVGHLKYIMFLYCWTRPKINNIWEKCRNLGHI